MSDSCQRLRPVLFRVAEGEASPEEALLAAQHLPTCTGCRILLNREHRLAGLLERLSDPVGVDEAFLSDVMGAIPHEPPPRRRVLLRVVGGAGVLVLLALLITWSPAAPSPGGGAPPLALPGFDGGDRLGEGFAGLAQLVAAAAARAGASMVPALPELPHLHLLTVALIPLLGAGLLIGSMLVLFAAHSVFSASRR
jgi:predicted anti-sigma-YlaC factor YlaD